MYVCCFVNIKQHTKKEMITITAITFPMYVRSSDVKAFEDFRLKYGKDTSKRIMLLIKRDMGEV